MVGAVPVPVIDKYQRPLVTGLDDKRAADVLDRPGQREAAGGHGEACRTKCDPLASDNLRRSNNRNSNDGKTFIAGSSSGLFSRAWQRIYEPIACS